MDNKNTDIGCSVNECKYHHGAENYCTLQHIDVVKNNNDPSTIQFTDCGSYENKQ